MFITSCSLILISKIAYFHLLSKKVKSLNKLPSSLNLSGLKTANVSILMYNIQYSITSFNVICDIPKCP